MAFMLEIMTTLTGVVNYSNGPILRAERLKSPALRGFIARLPCGLPGWGLAINVSVEKPTNHALVLSVML